MQAEGTMDGIRWAKEHSSSDQRRRICQVIEESRPHFDWLPDSSEWRSNAQYLASIALGVVPETTELDEYSMDWGTCWNFWQPFMDATATGTLKDHEIAEKLCRFEDLRYACTFVVGAYSVVRKLTRSSQLCKGVQP